MDPLDSARAPHPATADPAPRSTGDPASDSPPANERPEPLDVARRLVAERWPEATVALLAGSVARGDGGATSDLDVVVVLAETPPRGACRSSFTAEGWPVEAFVHSETTLARVQAEDAARRRPSLAQMVAEGRVLRDADGRASRLKQAATALLAAGPAALPSAELERVRYRLGDLLRDLRGAQGDERPLVAAEVALAAGELALDLGGHWRGGSSWTLRRLEALSPGLGRELAAALAAACTGEAARLERFVERITAPIGGTLFDGYEAHERPAPDPSQED